MYCMLVEIIYSGQIFKSGEILYIDFVKPYISYIKFIYIFVFTLIIIIVIGCYE